MGIWMELGIFIVVLGWGFWQLYDVKQAKAHRIAEEARRAERAGQTQMSPSTKEDAPPAVPPA